MRTLGSPRPSIPPESADRAVPFGTREIVIPHDRAAGPVTAVRNVLLQASLAELRAHGHYERYAKLIDPRVLEQLLSGLGPGWVPLDLAFAHYEACEKLCLTREEFAAMGDRVGDRVQDAVLVSLAKKVRENDFDLWLAVPALHRMWPRLFQGGSIQVVKLGPKEQLLEERGIVLNRFSYYRHGHVAALCASRGALGVRMTSAQVVSYAATTDEMVIRLAWA
jgi:hypothetical protein